MPVTKTESLGKERSWALWHVTETEQELAFLAMESCPEEVIHPQKRLEWLAGRALIRSIVEDFGLSYQGLRKNEHGKPFLKGLPHHISLTHSFPLVAAQVDVHQPVGIDLEEPKEKLRRIAPRVFAPDEVRDAGEDIVKLCVYWCAKEALYKIHGQRNVLFSDHLVVAPFQLAHAGIVTGAIRFDAEKTIVRLQYLVESDFVIVFTGSS